MTLKILAADYVLPVSSAPIARGGVVVEDERIKAVGKAAKLKEKFPEAFVQDFGEAAIMPGLVNCHSHLELSLMRGYLDDVEDDFFKWLIKTSTTRGEKLTVRDLEISALLGACEGARAGITCFGDIGRFGWVGLKALQKAGLRGVVFQETEFSPLNGKAKEDFTKLKEKFRSLQAEENELVRAGLSPHAPYTVSRNLFELITDFALTENIKLSIHAAESTDEEQLMFEGRGRMADFYRERGIEWSAPQKNSVEYLSEIGVLQAQPLLAHCIHTKEEDFALIAESRSGIAHCPKSNAKFGHRVAPFERFLDYGLRVGLGSDSVASNNTCDLLEEGRFAALTARARQDKERLVTAGDVIETMTLGGARALRLDQEIGSLDAGKQADLTVITLSHPAQQPVHDIYSTILFASTSRDVAMTMVAGKEIYAQGKSTSIDESELKIQIKEIARKMC